METIKTLPGHLIRRMQQQAVATFTAETQAAGFDLTPVQFAALATLERKPGIEQATLAAAIAYDRVTIGGVVARLEARGLVERSVSKTDRRARNLQLTDRGAALLRTVWPAVRRAQDQMLDNLDAAERTQLIALLTKAIHRDDAS
ncbi:MarR family transcriptional regulator [Rhodobacter aestuarii]|uniref:Transcriptional regulator, MarR family n=1 Tax=Rhodobacter aestuarii TaxID=453582 RepID=A0A1N7IZM8_9RHOB|nr:MarR family transcriptional regulator [Rhodobacter aestuarii]PTV97348.1 MarR family transcriptional regulator [Rhodobacter aestuarii]SIS42510.1 transcriptional regulator, MarR family [Rhodobacter aestuarii]